MSIIIVVAIFLGLVGQVKKKNDLVYFVILSFDGHGKRYQLLPHLLVGVNISYFGCHASLD